MGPRRKGVVPYQYGQRNRRSKFVDEECGESERGEGDASDMEGSESEEDQEDIEFLACVQKVVMDTLVQFGLITAEQRKGIPSGVSLETACGTTPTPENSPVGTDYKSKARKDNVSVAKNSSAVRRVKLGASTKLVGSKIKKGNGQSAVKVEESESLERAVENVDAEEMEITQPQPEPEQVAKAFSAIQALGSSGEESMETS